MQNILCEVAGIDTDIIQIALVCACIAIVVAVIILIVFVYKKRQTNKKRQPARFDQSQTINRLVSSSAGRSGTRTARMPHPANTPSVPRRTPTRMRTPAPARRQSTTGRVPHSATEYLNYRYCPACHSANERNHQVIFKNGSTFRCAVCQTKFDVFGNRK